METYDFGNGPVPAHQHASGGGWVADSATVADEVFVGPDAKIAGGTFYGGTFWGGIFRGDTFHGGTFYDGIFRGGIFRGGTFYGGTFYGGTFTRTPLIITGFRYPVIISDNTVAIGCQIHPPSFWFSADGVKTLNKHTDIDYLPALRALVALHGCKD